MDVTRRIGLPGAVLVSGLLAACGPSARAAEAPTPIAERVVVPSSDLGEGLGPNVWLGHVGEQTTAVAWLGPPMRSADGRPTRFCTVVLSRPGTPHPLSCRQVELGLDTDDPIVCERLDGMYRFEMRPADGMRWGDVVVRDQVKLQHDGFP